MRVWTEDKSKSINMSKLHRALSNPAPLRCGFFGKQTFAGLAIQLQNVEHCPLLQVAQTGCSRTEFPSTESVKNPAYRFLRQAHVSSEWRLTRLREPLTALLAFPAFDTPLSRRQACRSELSCSETVLCGGRGHSIFYLLLFTA
jgi:hypothetical protein